jgi:hypothetical protein
MPWVAPGCLSSPGPPWVAFRSLWAAFRRLGRLGSPSGRCGLPFVAWAALGRLGSPRVAIGRLWRCFGPVVVANSVSQVRKLSTSPPRHSAFTSPPDHPLFVGRLKDFPTHSAFISTPDQPLFVGRLTCCSAPATMPAASAAGIANHSRDGAFRSPSDHPLWVGGF